MPDTDSRGSCVFYSETWEGGHQVGEERRLCPLHREGSSSVPLRSHPKPDSSAGISSEVHHRLAVKSCLGKRANHPAKAGRSQPRGGHLLRAESQEPSQAPAPPASFQHPGGWGSTVT